MAEKLTFQPVKRFPLNSLNFVIVKTYPCFCSIIPPHLVDKLKEEGLDTTADTQKLNRSFRQRRSLKLQFLTPLALTAPGLANRLVYDSKTTQNQRLSLKRREGNDPTPDDSINRAFDYAGIVRAYYRTVLNWNSVDNSGSDLIMNVHFGKKYSNAFWDGDEMTFGDGDNEVFTDFTKSLDVTAHEMTHGVVQFTAGLVYRAQPGALNEHYADVFGSAIKQYYRQQTAATADWLIGDEIMAPALQGMAIRSMKAPGTAYNHALLGRDPQPAHMDNYYNGSRDNFGVHINSGIPNKVFYLVSIGIETEKAAVLWFETLKTLKPSTSFKGFKSAIKRTATKLIRTHILPAETKKTVEDAFAAVGL